MVTHRSVKPYLISTPVLPNLSSVHSTLDGVLFVCFLIKSILMKCFPWTHICFKIMAFTTSKISLLFLFPSRNTLHPLATNIYWLYSRQSFLPKQTNMSKYLRENMLLVLMSIFCKSRAYPQVWLIFSENQLEKVKPIA